MPLSQKNSRLRKIWRIKTAACAEKAHCGAPDMMNAIDETVFCGNQELKMNVCRKSGACYAPNFCSFPACASATAIRCFMGRRPSPPVIQARSPKLTARSGRQVLAVSKTGTGCQL